MAGMFGMMNVARLGVGMQGIAIGEVAYQNGLAYAHERRVGHALTGPKEPDKPADLEIVHPDVQPHAAACAHLRRRRARARHVDHAQHAPSRNSNRAEKERRRRCSPI